MTLLIGQVTLNGSDAQNARMQPFVQAAVDLLGDRFKPVTVEVRTRVSMPRYRDPRPGDKPTDGHAEGFWRAGPRRILIADDVIPRDDLPETLGHEWIHLLFEDWFTPGQKRTLLGYLDPRPENYSDTQVNGKDRGYPALPEECIAVWGSAALFGFAKPAYSSLYKRTISGVVYPAVKAVMLGTLPPAPIPAPDPCADVKAQLDAANAELALLRTKIAAARADLA